MSSIGLPQLTFIVLDPTRFGHLEAGHLSLKVHSKAIPNSEKIATSMRFMPMSRLCTAKSILEQLPL